jgi:uncharacterized membrane protein
MASRLARHANRHRHGLLRDLRRYIIAGILTVLPFWVTWLLVKFLVDLLTRIGGPAAHRIAQSYESTSPWIAVWVEKSWVIATIAIAIVVFSLIVIGWIATKVVGRRLIAGFDRMIDRIPLIKVVYGSVKKLVSALQQKPENIQRVVLIDFPSPEMKTVGLVTRTFNDADTGRELAAVYVPTTPNPTSGYLEIVPIERITPTDWSVDQAMTFIISGGAVAPESLHYDKAPSAPE